MAPHRLIRLALVLLALAPYVQTLGFGFTFDDAQSILAHPGVLGPLSLANIVFRDAWGLGHLDTIGIWRPFVTLTLWADEHLDGGHARMFHLTNLVLYVTLILVADRFLARWCGDLLSAGARFLALAAFASLAIHADVVPNASIRAEMLAALFSIVALDAVTRGPDLGVREVGIAGAALFLALLSKESSAPIAVLVPVFGYRAHSLVSDSREVRRGPMIALAATCTALLAVVWGFRALRMPFMRLGPNRAMENPLLAMDDSHRLLGALDVLALYLRHVVTGAELAPDYSYSEPPVLRDGAVGIVLGAAFVLACVVLLVRSWSRAPRLADALLALGASYLVVSNFVTPASAIANRMFFFPSFWLCVVVAMLLDGVVKTPRARQLAFAATALFIGLQSRSAALYAASWVDDATLYRAAALQFPNVYRTQRNLAHALADEGSDDAAAYHLVAAEVIYSRYPAPVARDAVRPFSGDDPLPDRLAQLRGSFGATATCGAAVAAASRLRSWQDPRAASALDDWRRNECH